MKLFGLHRLTPSPPSIPLTTVIGQRYIVGMDYRPGRDRIVLNIRYCEDEVTMRHEEMNVSQAALNARAVDRTGSSDAVWDDEDLCAESGAYLPPSSVR